MKKYFIGLLVVSALLVGVFKAGARFGAWKDRRHQEMTRAVRMARVTDEIASEFS